MKLPLYQVDAFAGALFGGNPAAVVILSDWLPTETLQSIALENNLSETSFIVPGDGHFDLRWFTPQIEVDLCGHATLAGAHVLWEHGYAATEEIVFRTLSGELRVKREGELLAMDFPSRPPDPTPDTGAVAKALGARPRQVLASRDLLAVFETEEQVRNLAPDFAAVAALDTFAVIATAPGTDCDFVSRFFAPRAGVPEDPATGSAHSTLIPYWATRLGKDELYARQVSVRGGEFYCELRGDRVKIAGRVVDYLRGEIHV